MSKSVKVVILVFTFSFSLTISNVAQAGNEHYRAVYIEWLVANLGPSAFSWLANYLGFAWNDGDQGQTSDLINDLNQDQLEDVIDNVVLASQPDIGDQNLTDTNLPELSSISLSPTSFHEQQIVVAGEEYFALSVDQFIGLLMQYRQTISDDESTNRNLRMIISAMTRSHQLIQFETFEDACKEVIFRLFMIEHFSRLTNVTRYNGEDDTYRLNNNWKPIVCYHKEGRKFKGQNDVAYVPKNQKEAYNAIGRCYSQTNNCNLLDCGGTVIAHTYGGIAVTEGRPSFDQLIEQNPNLMVIAPPWVQFKFKEKGKKGNGKRVSHPIFESGLLHEVEIISLDDLLPGDIVYFMNHPSYEDLAPEGWWAGEYCIYLGTFDDRPMFAGLGAGPATYDELISLVRYYFIEDTGLSFPIDTNDDALEEIIGDAFPSLCTTIFGMHAYRLGGFLSFSKRGSN